MVLHKIPTCDGEDISFPPATGDRGTEAGAPIGEDSATELLLILRMTGALGGGGRENPTGTRTTRSTVLTVVSYVLSCEDSLDSIVPLTRWPTENSLITPSLQEHTAVSVSVLVPISLSVSVPALISSVPSVLTLLISLLSLQDIFSHTILCEDGAAGGRVRPGTSIGGAIRTNFRGVQLHPPRSPDPVSKKKMVPSAPAVANREQVGQNEISRTVAL